MRLRWEALMARLRRIPVTAVLYFAACGMALEWEIVTSRY